MFLKMSDRGFTTLHHPNYINGQKYDRLVSESSAVGTYEDSMDKPGSSFLWVGNAHHLNRDDVKELILFMECWLECGELDGGLGTADTP